MYKYPIDMNDERTPTQSLLARSPPCSWSPITLSLLSRRRRDGMYIYFLFSPATTQFDPASPPSLAMPISTMHFCARVILQIFSNDETRQRPLKVIASRHQQNKHDRCRRAARRRRALTECAGYRDSKCLSNDSYGNATIKPGSIPVVSLLHLIAPWSPKTYGYEEQLSNVSYPKSTTRQSIG